MKKKTTVDLTDYGQVIKDQMVNVYGLRNILSSGLALLDAMEPADREQLIGLIAKGSNSQIQAFVDEWSARCDSKVKKRTPSHKPSATG